MSPDTETPNAPESTLLLERIVVPLLPTTQEFDAFMATLKIGERCNVRRPWPGDAPMVRVVTSIERIKRGAEHWVYWRWTPESHTPEGTMDCGYSGYRIE